jgi:hypothetical protein
VDIMYGMPVDGQQTQTTQAAAAAAGQLQVPTGTQSLNFRVKLKLQVPDSVTSKFKFASEHCQWKAPGSIQGTWVWSHETLRVRLVFYFFKESKTLFFLRSSSPAHASESEALLIAVHDS